MIDFDDLLRRARAGDPESEERLFGGIQARILSLARKRIWDEEAAADLAQETIRTALERYRGAEMPGGFVGWMVTILHHKIGNHLKHRAVENRVLSPDDHPESVERPHPTWEVLDGIRLADALDAGLRRASSECRRIFDLLLQGAGRSEIQAALGGAPMGTIDSRISRCRAALLAWIESHADSPAVRPRGHTIPGTRYHSAKLDARRHAPEKPRGAE